MNRTSKILFISVIVILIIGRIVYVQSGKKVIKTEYPIEKIELDKDVVSIFISDNANLSDIVNMDIFKGLTPHMSNEEIMMTMGEPDDTADRFDTKFLVYYTSQGRIETGVSSGVLSNDQFYYTGICMFYRHNFSRDFLFNNVIVKYLPKDITNKQIGVFVKNKCDFVINLSSKQEDWIQWKTEDFK